MVLSALVPRSALKGGVEAIAPIVHGPDRQAIGHRSGLHRKHRVGAHTGCDPPLRARPCLNSMFERTILAPTPILGYGVLGTLSDTRENDEDCALTAEGDRRWFFRRSRNPEAVRLVWRPGAGGNGAGFRASRDAAGAP